MRTTFGPQSRTHEANVTDENALPDDHFSESVPPLPPAPPGYQETTDASLYAVHGQQITTSVRTPLVPVQQNIQHITQPKPSLTENVSIPLFYYEELKAYQSLAHRLQAEIDLLKRTPTSLVSSPASSSASYNTTPVQTPVAQTLFTLKEIRRNLHDDATLFEEFLKNLSAKYVEPANAELARQCHSLGSHCSLIVLFHVRQYLLTIIISCHRWL